MLIYCIQTLGMVTNYYMYIKINVTLLKRRAFIIIIIFLVKKFITCPISIFLVVAVVYVLSYLVDCCVIRFSLNCLGVDYVHMWRLFFDF